MHLPEVQEFEDPQGESDARVELPIRMAVRNSVVALLAIALACGFLWAKAVGDDSGPVAFWIWGAVAGFAVAVCFAHALLGARYGGRRAAAFLKAVTVLVLAGMLFAVWWILRPKDGAV
jgi:hypothetical protein